MALRSETAPAKINLDLIVTGRRMDGYHELDSLVVFTAFGDRLEFEPADEFSLSIQGPFAHLTPKDDNIILKAANLLKASCPWVQPLAFRLHKNLPVASGIGGGSSDAAAAMRAIRATSDMTISDEGLRDLGSTLGADIPVCLYARPARMRGTGSRLDPVRGLPEMPLVLINPNRALNTASVFQSADLIFEDFRRPTLQMNSSVVNLALWLQESRNDLEPSALNLVPEIATILGEIATHDGVLMSRMSGSGATCFGMFTDQKRADRAAALIAQKHPSWWITSTHARG